MNSLNALLNALGEGLQSTDPPLRRFVAVVALWPLVTGLCSIFGLPALTATVGLMPMLCVMGLAMISPTMVVVGTTVVEVWRVIRIIIIPAVVNLVIAAVLTVIPVWREPGLLPLVLLLFYGIFTLWVVGGSYGRLNWILVPMLLGVFTLLTLGGIDATTTAFAPTPPRTRSYPVVRPACKAPGNEFIWAIHDGGGGTFYVPPGGCETPILVMPEGWFTACRRATVEVKRHYVDGSSDPDYVEVPPTQDRKPLKQVTGFSYRNRNSGETPIHVVAGERCG